MLIYKCFQPEVKNDYQKLKSFFVKMVETEPQSEADENNDETVNVSKEADLMMINTMEQGHKESQEIDEDGEFMANFID